MHCIKLERKGNNNFRNNSQFLKEIIGKIQSIIGYRCMPIYRRHEFDLIDLYICQPYHDWFLWTMMIKPCDQETSIWLTITLSLMIFFARCMKLHELYGTCWLYDWWLYGNCNNGTCLNNFCTFSIHIHNTYSSTLSTATMAVGWKIGNPSQGQGLDFFLLLYPYNKKSSLHKVLTKKSYRIRLCRGCINCFKIMPHRDGATKTLNMIIV